METLRTDLFMLINGRFFEAHHLSAVRQKISKMDDNKWFATQSAQFKDPTIALLISLFAGGFGIDRFYIGDTGLGVAKLLTCGGLGIWTIIDWFSIQGVTKEKNMETFNQI